MKEGSKDNADSGRVNSIARRKKIDAGDGTDVIEKWGESRNQKTSLGLEDTSDEGRNSKEYLGDGH